MKSTRSEAKAAGETKYFTGKACPHGHVAPRQTSSGTCSECLAVRRREYMRKWAAENPEEKKARARRDYEAHSDAYKARAVERYYADPEAARAAARKYAAENAEAARQKTREWNAKNPERKKLVDKKWLERNRSEANAYKARYRAARKGATPPWLTAAHFEEIKEVYRLARQLSKFTGEPYEVDHIIPLQGKVVCGLHVPWNLRAVPKHENNRRTRIWDGDAG